MAWTYLPEEVVDCLPPTGSEIGKLFVTAKTTKKRRQQSQRVYGTDYYLLRPYGTTWGHSLSTMRRVGSLLGDWLDTVIILSSPQDSRANRSALPGDVPERVTAVMGGLTPFALLGKYAPSTFYSKTSPVFYQQEPLTANVEPPVNTIKSENPLFAQHAKHRWLKPTKTLFSTLEPFSETWPKSGMMLSGECYPHPTWVHRTKEIVSGYNAHGGIKRTLIGGRNTLPTPTCSDAKASHPNEYAAYAEHGVTSGNRLRALVVYATPNTMDALPPKSTKALNREMMVTRPGRTKPANLRDQIGNAGNWRTPQVGDIEHGGKNARDSSEAMHLSAQAHRASAGMWSPPHASDLEGGAMEMRRGVAGHYKLRDQVQPINASFWPTPKARDFRSGGTSPEKIEKRIDKRRAAGLSIDLTEIVCHSELAAVKKYPTPSAADNRDRGNMSDESVKRRVLLGKQVGLSQFVKKEASSGKLNPFWGEWLMGWPIGWTSLEPLPYDVFMDWLQKTSDGTWWDVDPADIGEMERLETGIARHKARWMQIGNGQVSLTAAVAEELLNE